MKYKENWDGKPFSLPKVHIKDTIKEKSTFVDHNRGSYQEFSLDDLDLSWLDKSRNKDESNNKVKKIKKRYLEINLSIFLFILILKLGIIKFCIKAIFLD